MALDDGRVVSSFVAQGLRGDGLTVFGDGSQTRSFCYVSDLVDGIVAAARAPAFVGPVNLGNPTEFTVRELASLVQELLNIDRPVVYKPLPQDDPQRRRPDITRARELLGFEPKVPLREGLRLTIDDLRARLAERAAHRPE